MRRICLLMVLSDGWKLFLTFRTSFGDIFDANVLASGELHLPSSGQVKCKLMRAHLRLP